MTSLAELRPTSVEVLARGPGRCVTAECKLTEREFGGGCRVPGLLRRVSWQRLVAALARAPELGYLTATLGRKYGLAPA